jgi:hypothetical protein
VTEEASEARDQSRQIPKDAPAPSDTRPGPGKGTKGKG